MDRFRAWLFQSHTEDQIRRWATSLSYFRFCRACGGHANDGDHFLAAISYTGEFDLLTLLASLGLTPHELPGDNPRPAPGRSYTSLEFGQFKNEIDDFPNLEQIGHCEVGGNKCFLWAAKQTLTFSVLGAGDDPYEVADSDCERALRIDTLLRRVADRVIDPPQDNRYCICPKYYPLYWEQ